MPSSITCPSTLRRVTAHEKRANVAGIVPVEHLPFIAFWVFAISRCIQSSGSPYAAALAHQQAFSEDGPHSLNFAADVSSDWNLSEDVASSIGVEDPDHAPDANDTTGSAPLTSAATENNAPLPNPFLPAFWDCLLLVGVFLAHVLLFFIQRWLIRAHVAIRFTPRPDLHEGCYAFVQPHPHQGEANIVPVHRGKADGKEVLYFVFQRQRFEIDEGTQTVSELDSPTSLQLREYMQHKGFESDSEVNAKEERYGDNSVHIPLPTFKDIYVKQILGPVPVFQIFCTLLWLLDEYWKYAIFNIGSILIFEGSTAFGRLKNISTLRGMGNKKSNVAVHRKRQWQELSTEKLLPGDVFELTKTEEEVTVPCDSLLLNGSAVMNEASLTGESTPQMKEALTVDDDNANDVLDMNNLHKVHVLYAGTTLLQHTEGKTTNGNDATSLKPPNGGVVCFALRTGFQSAQGKLVRMIEYSSEQVMSDTKETLILLALLLMFALCSSGYVMYKGLQEQKRSQYELVLRCVLILTSVVPPELPMQTAVAVNTALMSLWKSQVFCTEPFRVPYAGRVDYCLFDKTGTLTSDQLETVGVVPNGNSPLNEGGGVQLSHRDETPLPLQLVIAGCHSVVEVGGKHVGDPVETAALHWIGWELDAQTSKAKPGEKAPSGTSESTNVKVIHRFHFSSKLQRMSTLARISENGGKASLHVLCKGSPEAILERLADPPHWYSRTYRAMSENGMRVLALACKKLKQEEAYHAEKLASKGSGFLREEAETALEFAGFIAFSCRERKDSRQVVQNLRNGSHHVAMATGDNVLTALYISDEIALTGQDGSKGPLVLEDNQEGSLIWRPARDADRERLLECSFSPESISELDRSGHDLCMTGSSFWHAVNNYSDTWKHIEKVKVFARMSPDNKEVLMRALKDLGHHTLMCGDGANDVGALKQAHVGVALLSGFASANTTRDGEKKPDELSEEEKQVAKKEQMKKAQEAKKNEMQEQKQLQEELKRKQQEFYEEELEKLQAQGQQGAMVQFKATGNAFNRLMQYQKKRIAEIKQKHGGAAAAGAQSGSIAQQAAAMAQDTDTGEVPMVKLGDASVAAPFTSKLPSIRSTADIIRQGRCTLVSTIQQQQILALNCLIAAYSLSALYLDGVKSSEPQMIASGMLLTVASLAFSYARSVDELSPVRPIRSIFHPAISFSIIGQLAIHLGCMIYSINLARQYAPDEVAAMKESSYSQAGQREEHNESEQDPIMALFYGDTNFTPSLLNTVVFLIETAQQVSVMMVNYKGRPFMISSLENRPMLYSLALCCFGTFACAFEVFPWLNKRLQLQSLPSDEFRYKMLFTLAMSVFGSLLWDRLCVGVFAPDLLITGHKDAFKALPSWRDSLPQYARVAFWSVFVAGSAVTQNPLFIVAGFLVYSRLGVREKINKLSER